MISLNPRSGEDGERVVVGEKRGERGRLGVDLRGPGETGMGGAPSSLP